MNQLCKVVWSEGMHLAPHHFQAQNRYFEDSIAFAVSSLFYKPYGLAGCALSEDALRNGTLAVVHARGIFADGLAFEMPESDPLPEPRNITDAVLPTRDSHTALLAVAPYVRNGANCQLAPAEPRPNARYIAEKRLVADETSGGEEKPVALGRKQFRLLLDNEIGEGMVTLPLARIRRSGSGDFVLDPEFIPPVLHIAASEPLLLLLQRLIEILESKSEALTRPGRGPGRSIEEFAGREIASFWFLHTMHSALGPLRHHFETRRCHPERLYVELARLAGGLCTFALDSDPRTIPAYDHDHLDECFRGLDRFIRSHLEIVFPTNCVSIPLRAVADYFYTGEVLDERCLRRSRWVLSVSSPIGEAEVITRVPQLVKLCSSKFTLELVRRALPGLPLAHLPTPPPLSPRVDRQYFSVSKSGPCWDHLVQTKQVGVYVPAEIPKVELGLQVILDT
jgi:type VI secretion system protein ImpJ